MGGTGGRTATPWDPRGMVFAAVALALLVVGYGAWLDWQTSGATHFALTVPIALILLALGLLAVRLWRRQQAAETALHEVTQRREVAEEALRQAQKMEAIGRLTGGIAHDFNNHLTVISSNIEMLQRRLPPDNPALTRMIDGAMAGVQRAATLAHRLLAFSRQQPMEPEPLDVGRVVSNMTELLRRTLGESITIETALASGLWQTRVDPSQLENVLLNLAVNARDAMPQGGKLTVKTANIDIDDACAGSPPDATAGQYVMLAVIDTGSEPVGQATGLGLSIVDGFARQSGGYVAIDSVPGGGTAVTVYLPRFIEPTARPTSAATGPRTEGARETILVVEDDEEVRRTSVEALREIGYQVLDAPDAMEGVRLIVDRGGIDLLFTDVGLPGGVDGRALADAAQSAQPALRVLFTTGYTGNPIMQNGKGRHFLAKPFTPTILAEKVREVLAGPAAQTAAEDAR